MHRKTPPSLTLGFHAKLKNAAARRGVFTEDTIGPGDALATDGDLTPPDPDVVLFRQFKRPSLEPTGDAVWHAALTASTRGIFRTRQTYVVRSGIQAPFASGQLADVYERLAIVGAKDIVFHSGVVDGPVVMGQQVLAGIFRCSGGDGNCYSGTGVLAALVVTADLVPDRPGRRFCKLGRNVNSSSYGIVAFEARLSGIPSVAGLFRCDPDPASDPCPAASPAELLLRDGEIVDSQGTILRRFENISISNAGDIVFQCGVRSETLRGRAQYAYLAASGTPALIAAKGTVIPGPPARTVTKIGRPAMSPGGRVAFLARTRDEAGRRKLGIYLHE